MSTAQRPSEDAPKKAAPTGLTAKGKAHWYEIRARNAMVQAIQGETWGGNLSRAQAAAFAEFMRRFKLDISEIDNLGGRPYRNGRYYMRKCAELAAQSRVEWYKGRHLGSDPRLDRLAAAGEQWAIDEKNDRLRECIRLGVPDGQEIVYLVTVKMKELANATEGVKWWAPQTTGPAKRKKSDPVGDEHPVTSTETRAWRRCGRLFAAEIPELYAAEQEMEFAAAAIVDAAVAEAEEVESEVQQRVITEGPAQPLYKPVTVTEEQVNAESMPYTGTREPALWHPDTPIPKGEIGYTDPKPFERVVVTGETKAAAVEMAKKGLGTLTDPYAENPFNDGPIVYTGPQWCEPCQRTCLKSNDHKGDCARFAD